MQITQCLHTAILVSDLDKAEHFYSDVLGLTKVNRTLKYPGIWYQIGNYQIHLLVHADLTVHRQNVHKWGRNPHIALAVVNLEAAKAQLQYYNYSYQESASGRTALFTQDPDGNIIEITQI